jgi:hypothetical protein
MLSCFEGVLTTEVAENCTSETAEGAEAAEEHQNSDND